MASVLTIEQLQLLAADRVDMLEYNGGVASLSSFLNPGMFLYSVNHELAALWDHLINAHEDYVIRREMISVVADQENYILPKDFYKARKVFPIVSGRREKSLKKFNLDETNYTSNILVTATDINNLKYKFMGQRLWLYPTPSFAGDLELWYIPQYKELVNNNDLVNFIYPNGWEDYVVNGIAAKAAEKEESFEMAQVCIAAQGRALGRILQTVQDRDEGEPEEMIDAEGFSGDYS